MGVVLSPEKLSSRSPGPRRGGRRPDRGRLPRVSEEDAEAIRLIADAGLRAEVWGFARAVQADVELLAELGVRAAVVESPISDAKLAALGVSHDDMLDRIRRAVSFASGEGSRSRSSASTARGRARLLPPRLRSRGRGRRCGGGRRGHDRRRDARGSRLPRRPGGRLARRARPLARPRRLRPRDGGSSRRRQAGATWVHGTVNGMGSGPGTRTCSRSRSPSRPRHPDPARPDPGARPRRGSCASARIPACALGAAHGRQPLHARERRRREPVPRPVRDRALRRRGRRCGAGLVLEEVRLDSIRLKVAEARPRRAGGAVRRTARGGEEAGTKKRRLVTDAELRRLARG